MKKLYLVTVILIACAAFFLSACARMPTAKYSAKELKHYFKKYGKKYPDTVYGKPGVKEVEITSQQEIHKHLVAVESFITLNDGTVQRINATIQKGPLGWKFVSWENSTGM